MREALLLMNARIIKPDNTTVSLGCATLALAALSLLSGFLFDFTALPAAAAGYAVLALLALLAAAAVVLALRRSLTPERALALLIAAGFLMRLLYIACYLASQRQHDVVGFTGETGGHGGYIFHFYENGLTLPEGNPIERWSFYNPPLWHALCGLWMRFNTALGLPFDRACENLQCVSLACSALCMPASIAIFRRFKIARWPLVFASALVCLHPQFFLLAGSLNNDILCALLTLASFAAALAWYDEPTLPRILAAALCVGLALLAKTSGAVVAPAMALLFIIKFIKERKSRPAKLLGQYAAFGAVSLPIGLWWSARCWFKFNIPPGFVPLLPEDSDQYVGGVSALKRLFAPQLDTCFLSLSNENSYIADGISAAEYNISSALLKTSVFGEYTYAEIGSKTYYLCWALFIVNALLALAALAAMVAVTVRAFRSKSPERARIAALDLFWLTSAALYVKFCFDYPHTCSMDFRYILPTCVLGALSLALWLRDGARGRVGECAQHALVALGAVFCVLSVAVYALICVFSASSAVRLLYAAATAAMLAAMALSARRDCREYIKRPISSQVD